MSVRRGLGLLIVVLLTACGVRRPVTSTMTIEPDPDHARVSVTVRTELGEETNERLAELRTTIMDRHDPWTARFASINAEWKRTVFEESHGVLRAAEWSAKFPADDLQKFLGDAGTVQVTDGDGWTELSFYPSSSTRATRQQREHVEKVMHMWAGWAVRYLRALDRLYNYLDRQPQRAPAVFTILLSDKDERSVLEDEDALLRPVDRAVGAIVDHADAWRDDGPAIAEELDLTFNPLPAEIVVRLPSPLISVEGFDRRDERTVAIPRTGLVDALSSLEGRWASPDPLAMIVRASSTNTPRPSAEEVAARPRHSTPVIPIDEVEKAFAARLRPAAVYRVRWSK